MWSTVKEGILWLKGDWAGGGLAVIEYILLKWSKLDAFEANKNKNREKNKLLFLVKSVRNNIIL